MTLQGLMNHLFQLYGLRNRIFLSGLRERIDFLHLAIGDLQDAIRKGVTKDKLGTALARVVSRIFCVAENFPSFPLVKTMARKYPYGKCSYCQQSPCLCPEKRLNFILEKASKEQMSWTLRDWGLHLDRLYGERNREKGVENLVCRLFKEQCELLNLQMGTSHKTRVFDSLAGIVEEFALELADSLAWTIGVANYFGIDLEQAVLDRYGTACWKCRKCPCECLEFKFEQVNWEEI